MPPLYHFDFLSIIFFAAMPFIFAMLPISAFRYAADYFIILAIISC